MIINCPHCSGQMTVTAETAGKNITCPHCAKILQAPVPPTQPTSPSPAPMATLIKPGEGPVKPPQAASTPQRPPNPAPLAPQNPAQPVAKAIPVQAPPPSAGNTPVGTPIGSAPGSAPPPRKPQAKPAGAAPRVNAGAEDAGQGPMPSQAVMRARDIKKKSGMNTILLVVGIAVGLPLLCCGGIGAYFVTMVDGAYNAATEVQRQRDEAALDYAQQALATHGYSEIQNAVVSDAGTLVQVRGQALKGGWHPFICTFNVSQNADGLTWDLENVTVSGAQLYQRSTTKK